MGQISKFIFKIQLFACTAIVCLFRRKTRLVVYNRPHRPHLLTPSPDGHQPGSASLWGHLPCSAMYENYIHSHPVLLCIFSCVSQMTARPGQATKTQDLSFRTRPPSRQDRPSETVSSRIKKSKIAQNVLHAVLFAGPLWLSSRDDHGAGPDGAPSAKRQADAGLPDPDDPRRRHADALEHVHHCQIGKFRPSLWRINKKKTLTILSLLSSTL